ncbi:hypothetical protein GGTG_07984 [Gaeumannomyces tritici R3-111a-1]|uniref:Uncharacterized protein n=1 Tax=Gaeumannomyces tritici (strain R3-111a-1) TaxID=644352 RepID=J3P396_GAET3|nr:hypothetical protein GGTG_07984 [Gaeumannomyces tritici R3-111a-1]EJT74138.1 hypothetical protein GGTG_07984 [Gaeumannomyces tritici R3-111a-1]
MRFSTVFQLGAIAALGAPVLAQQQSATNNVAAVGARDLEQPMILEARRDPGLNALPKRPKKKAPTTAPATTPANLPPARGAGRAAALRNTHPTFGQQQKRSVLEARRDPGLNALPKRPKKKAPTTAPATAPADAPAAAPANLPPARGAGRAAALRNILPTFGQQQKRSVLEARRDPGLNALPKRPKKKAPTTAPAAAPATANLPPARGAGRAAALRNILPTFGQQAPPGPVERVY